MQVKKFEARSMKEALEMVKTQLGPDAIILSARDNNRSFGLVGEGSVEITAAVSEETLHKKKFVESRLKDSALQQFQNSPARMQKELIQKMVHKHTEKNSPRAATSTRYIEIEEPSRQQQVPQFDGSGIAEQLRAEQAQNAPTKTSLAVANNEVSALKAEIMGLREIISKFQSVPQQMNATHPGSDFGLAYDVSFMFERLVSSGVAPEIAAEMLSQVQSELPPVKLKNKSIVEGWVARKILEAVPIDSDISSKIHLFIGPSGSGKTSSLVKLASQLAVNEGKRIALITTDTSKVGAADQMRIYAQILNVPFAVVRSQADWAAIMKYLNGVDAVLVDFPGMSLKSTGEVERLQSLMPQANMKSRIHLVLSASLKDQDITDVAKRYSMVGYHDVVFSGLDESRQHGAIFNFTQRFRVPLHSFGLGARVPDDFEFASKERVLDLILRITEAQRQQGAQP